MTIKQNLQLASLSILTALLSACATVPFDYPKEHSAAITDTGETAIARDVRQWTDTHDGLSGFYPLISGMDAFGTRLRLIEAAELSIDAQYFLMKDDAAGHIFTAALLQAADRGVRIRFLLDDVFTSFKDENLALINQHPNIEVRLFNPVARRGISILNFLSDFKRANRRMHNKSFTVDNQVTIVGGRNIADEYFELRSDAEFLDFDVIGIGPVAAEVATEFDLFWNHSRSVPMEAFDDDIKAHDLGAVRPDIDAHLEHAYRSTYARAIDSQLLDDLYEDRVPLYPANAEVVTDDPEKLVNKISEDQQTLVNYLAELAADAESEIIVVTPYFVPGKNGVAFWQGIASRGVQVIVLTNSLASNNHLAVHSAYANYRRAIIEAGVELYEARANAVRQDTRGEPGAAERLTLHSKGVIIDRELIFVGSLNMDPRAIDINTEMGIVIRSPDMADDIAQRILADLPEFAYRVELRDNGKLHWRGRVDGTEVIETKEPLTSRWQRFMAFLLKIVPEQQL